LKFKWNWPDVFTILFNGSSEMIGQLSIGFTTWVFNSIILSRLGVDGVAAYTIVGYIAFVQIMIITGFATGLGPIVGYYYGAGDGDHISNVVKIALVAGFISGAVCWVVVLFSSTTIAALFSRGNSDIIDLARSGFVMFTAAFVLNGFNILITGYFTAIGNARISVIISSLRGLILINLFVFVLPLFFGNAGIWISYPLAELVTLVFVVIFFRNSWRDDLKGLDPV
jgi:Na+-driven multidrug efflux pump